MLETHYACPCLDKCPLNYAMSIIGGKWKMQIICALNNRGTLRYNELRRKMDGISNTVLASSLRELEEEGLVIRKEYVEVPIRVEYSTTTLCDRLMPILESLSDWGEALMQARGLTAHLSLTHEGGTAAAFVVLERREASASLKEEPECSTLR